MIFVEYNMERKVSRCTQNIPQKKSRFIGCWRSSRRSSRATSTRSTARWRSCWQRARADCPSSCGKSSDRPPRRPKEKTLKEIFLQRFLYPCHSKYFFMPRLTSKRFMTNTVVTSMVVINQSPCIDCIGWIKEGLLTLVSKYIFFKGIKLSLYFRISSYKHLRINSPNVLHW